MDKVINSPGQHPEVDEKIRPLLEGQLGPGCCEFYSSKIIEGVRAEYRISNCGNRELCDSIIKTYEGEFINYTQGQNCS